MNRTFASLALVFVTLALAGCDNSDDRVLQGWVEAELIFVSPDEQGRVETLKVREGDHVKKGDLLFTVDDDLQKADVVVRNTAVINAQQAFDRAKELLKSAAGTQRTYDDAEAALRQAKANLEWAQTRLARRNAHSPGDGTIEQIYYRPGETVPAGRPVVAFLPPGNLKIRFFAPQAALPELKYGDVVGISCDGCDKGLTAKISFIARSAEFTPPVIYSMEERAKLVFLIEARPDEGCEPLWLPEGVYRAHPQWRGPQCELGRIARMPYFAPSIDEPAVLELYREAMTDIGRRFPDIDQFGFMANDSGSGLSWAPCIYPGMNGPTRWRTRDPGERLRQLARRHAGGRRAGRRHRARQRVVQRAPRRHRGRGPRQAKAGPVHQLGHHLRRTVVRTRRRPRQRPVELPLPRRRARQHHRLRRRPAARLPQSRRRRLARPKSPSRRPTCRSPARCSKAYSPSPAPACSPATARCCAAPRPSPARRAAETLVGVWNNVKLANLVLSKVQQKGFCHLLPFAGVSMRWLVRPLVPQPEKLTPAEKTAHYRAFLFSPRTRTRRT